MCGFQILDAIRKFIDKVLKILTNKSNESFLVRKEFKELVKMYTYSDSDFRKKYYEDENALPIPHYIGTVYKEGTKSSKCFKDKELMFTNSCLKLIYIIFQCVEPILKILYPDGLSNINITDTIKSEKLLKKLKFILPPLTPEELYYAFKYLNDIEVRKALACVGSNAFNKIYKAYESNNKSAFIKEVGEASNIKISMSVYISLINNKSNFLLRQYLQNIDINNSLDWQQIMYAFSPSAMKLYKLNQNKETLAKMNLYELIKLYNEATSDYKTLISTEISNPDIPLAFREQAKDFWQKRNSVFDDIKVKENKSKSKDGRDTMVLNLIIEGILHAIHKLMQEEQVGALESKEKKDGFEQNVINTDKCTLGKSDFAWRLMGSCNIDICNKTYRKFLELLFLYLSGKDSRLEEIHALNVKLNENYCNTTKYIDTKINDFIFILGGELYEEENISDNPVLNWCYSPQYELVSFLYAFYGTEYQKSNTKVSREEKKLVINAPRLKSNGKNNCYSFMGKHIDLAINYRENAKARVEHWVKIIEDCCTIARYKISEEKKK